MKTAMTLGAVLLLAIGLVAVGPIVQDPGYHAFADQRTLFGVPNFWNVVTNLPFVMVALYGAVMMRRAPAAYWVLMAGTAAVGVGSGYYHWRPDDARLFWDRLPMAVAFMAVLAITVDRRGWLVPLVAAGVASVAWWRWSGDLRLYVLVQFGGMMAVAALLAWRRTGGAVWWTLGLYAMAKVLESMDGRINGHPWKHVVSAAAMFVYMAAVSGYFSQGRAGTPASRLRMRSYICCSEVVPRDSL